MPSRRPPGEERSTAVRIAIALALVVVLVLAGAIAAGLLMHPSSSASALVRSQTLQPAGA